MSESKSRWMWRFVISSNERYSSSGTFGYADDLGRIECPLSLHEDEDISNELYDGIEDDIRAGHTSGVTKDGLWGWYIEPLD